MNSQLYTGTVMHRRLQQVAYRFEYRVFNLYLDLDELPALPRRLRLFSHNRFNLFSLYDRDVGARRDTPLRPWLEALLARDGIELGGGKIYLLCYPRILGYVFNPLSVWYCHHRDGGLRAIVCEVHNTFGESHHYLLHAGDRGEMDWGSEHRAPKSFHVSPLVQMQAEYRFRLGRPDRQVRVHIHAEANGAAFMDAALTGTRMPLSDANLLRLFLKVPFLTLKVMALIHWQALKIWLRGAPFFPKPPPPANGVTSGWMIHGK